VNAKARKLVFVNHHRTPNGRPFDAGGFAASVCGSRKESLQIQHEGQDFTTGEQEMPGILVGSAKSNAFH
jgi:predicted urease superfamily metal-dependent hydrolase